MFKQNSSTIPESLKPTLVFFSVVLEEIRPLAFDDEMSMTGIVLIHLVCCFFFIDRHYFTPQATR